MLEEFTQAKLIEKMIKVLGKSFDSRKKYTRNEMIDAGMAEFSVFFPKTHRF